MIERFAIGMREANIYGLLFMILGLTFTSAAVQVGTPKAEVKPLLTLCLGVAACLITWGVTYNTLKHTSYVGETA